MAQMECCNYTGVLDPDPVPGTCSALVANVLGLMAFQMQRPRLN